MACHLSIALAFDEMTYCEVNTKNKLKTFGSKYNTSIIFIENALEMSSTK